MCASLCVEASEKALHYYDRWFWFARSGRPDWTLRFSLHSLSTNHDTFGGTPPRHDVAFVGRSSKRGRDDTEVKAERGDGIGEDLDEGEALPHRPHHRLFVGNSETCEVVELHMRGSDIRVADRRVGKAWADSKTFTKKPPKGWLTGIAHHRGLLYCLQYVGGLGRKSNVGCIVVLDAENELRYERKYVLPFQSPEGIAIRDEYVYVSLAESQIVRFSMTAEGRIDVTPESQTRCELASTGVCK